MKKYCDFCNKEYEFESHMHWMSHRGNCQLGPSFNQKCEKLRKCNVQKKEYILTCRCGKKYSEYITPYTFEKGTYKKTCSSTCSHKRTLSNETKQKISSSLKKSDAYKIAMINQRNPIVESVCISCGNKFKYVKRKNGKNRLFCTSECACKSKQYRDKISGIIKQQYENGKLVYGGTTKWYSVETSNGIIRVQGTYELRTCKILDYWKRKNIIRNWEYTKDRIKYIGDDGIEHNYLLDFKVFESDNNFYYIETKGYKRKNDDNKWKAVSDLKLKLVVWYENDISNEETKLGRWCNW